MFKINENIKNFAEKPNKGGTPANDKIIKINDDFINENVDIWLNSLNALNFFKLNENIVKNNDTTNII